MGTIVEPLDPPYLPSLWEIASASWLGRRVNTAAGYFDMTRNVIVLT